MSTQNSCEVKAIRIFTFGNFDITLNGESVFKASGRKYKNLELLKFFITNKERRIVPENIIDYFWSDKEYGDPRNALSTQVHRLKKTLSELGLMKKGENTGEYFELNFINGFYNFTTGNNCSIDFEEFKDKMALADSIKNERPKEAIDLYQEILDLYNGPYLEENIYSEWAVNVRNKYHRMYIQSAIKLMELLKNQDRYNEIVDLFEDINVLEPYEESFHVFFMEALVELKEYRYATSHYNYVASKMYKDIGVKPSSALKKIYRRVLRETDDNEEVDLFFIDKKLTEDELLEGAVFCETDYFKHVYNLEKRKSSRYGKSSVLMIITLVKDGSISKAQADKVMETIRDILWISLRKSDLVSRWNQTQVLALLMNVTNEQYLNVITRRIKEKFNNAVDSSLFNINVTGKFISSEKL